MAVSKAAKPDGVLPEPFLALSGIFFCRLQRPPLIRHIPNYESFLINDYILKRCKWQGFFAKREEPVLYRAQMLRLREQAHAVAGFAGALEKYARMQGKRKKRGEKKCLLTAKRAHRSIPGGRVCIAMMRSAFCS